MWVCCCKNNTSCGEETNRLIYYSKNICATSSNPWNIILTRQIPMKPITPGQVVDQQHLRWRLGWGRMWRMVLDSWYICICTYSHKHTGIWFPDNKKYVKRMGRIHGPTPFSAANAYIKHVPQSLYVQYHFVERCMHMYKLPSMGMETLIDQDSHSHGRSPMRVNTWPPLDWRWTQVFINPFMCLVSIDIGHLNRATYTWYRDSSTYGPTAQFCLERIQNSD